MVVRSRLGDGRRSGTAQTENTVLHTKYGRIRRMVVDEGGRSTGGLRYSQKLWTVIIYISEYVFSIYCFSMKVLFYTLLDIVECCM